MIQTSSISMKGNLKKIISFILLSPCLLISQNAFADVYVNGYTRSDGSYVGGHYRSSPNSSVYDNWSTYGNVNPYTCLLYTSPSPRDGRISRMPSSA